MSAIVSHAYIDDFERDLRHDAIHDTFCELSERPCQGEDARDQHLTTAYIELRYKARLGDARSRANAEKRRPPEPLVPLPASGEPPPELVGHVLACDLRDPARTLESADDFSRAREELAQLPVQVRETLWYSGMGYSASEIAGMQGRSPAAVRKERSRAHSGLPKKLFF